MGNSGPTGHPGRAEQEGWGAFGDAESSRLRLNTPRSGWKSAPHIRQRFLALQGSDNLQMSLSAWKELKSYLQLIATGGKSRGLKNLHKNQPWEWGALERGKESTRGINDEPGSQLGGAAGKSSVFKEGKGLSKLKRHQDQLRRRGKVTAVKTKQDIQPFPLYQSRFAKKKNKSTLFAYL